MSSRVHVEQYTLPLPASMYRIGISGWRYPGWRKTFYPEGLAQRKELEYASNKLNSIEINGSFYSLQLPTSYSAWAEQTPPEFLFSVKGPRFITHMKQLNDVRVPVANFFASGVLRLGRKLGPVLWQFPPRMKFNPAKFQPFLEMLPRDTVAAAHLACEHDSKVFGKCDTTVPEEKQRIVYAFEVRNESFKCDEFVALARRHNVAIVFADTAQRWPYMEDVTSDFIYCRLHGDTELYVSGYSDSTLDWWADRIRLWHSGKQPCDPACVSSTTPKVRKRDVYVYFDNDAKVRAPFDAMSLAERLTQKA